MIDPELVFKASAYLSEVAARGGLVTYTDVGALVGLDPGSYVLWNLLGEVSRISFTDGVLLSALVVNKATGYPGASFFTLALELDAPGAGGEKLAFWAKAVRDVHAHYGKAAT